MDFVVLPPKASSTAESLRALGYDLGTAVADILDNSITAGAENIWIDSHWAGEDSRIVIADDGSGMEEARLIEAMRIGSTSPLEPRRPEDLGRFGMGLKTASFSQCRRLTLCSRCVAGGHLSAWQWDIDLIRAENEWKLSRADEAAVRIAEDALRGSVSGTVVIWEKVDRLTGGTSAESQQDKDTFWQRLDVLKRHLGMTFHRFIEKRKVRIHLNGRPVLAWNPFTCAGEDMTREVGAETVGGVEATVFLLPHPSWIDSATVKTAGGVGGWDVHQGFYVYRNARLLVAGSWLGLGLAKEPAFNLARIRLDFPNSMDEQWKIDVRKSKATPPQNLKDWLEKLARRASGDSRKVHRYRGQISSRSSKEMDVLWTTKITSQGMRNRINREHPVVSAALSVESSRPAVSDFIKLLEHSFDLMASVSSASSLSASPEPPPAEKMSEEMLGLCLSLIDTLVKSGFTFVQAKERIRRMDPFHHFSGQIDEIKESEPSAPHFPLHERQPHAKADGSPLAS